MPVEDHLFEYEQHMDGEHIPWCSCGWFGWMVDDIEKAIESWENHCEQVFYEATGA